MLLGAGDEGEAHRMGITVYSGIAKLNELAHISAY